MKYALALAGGGTRGAFEVGVYKALRELGIEISAICGTSIGAVNGALFASGTDGEEYWKEITPDDVAQIKGNNLFSPASLLSAMKKLTEGGVDASAFKKSLAEAIDEKKVRNSGIDYGLCTYRLDTKKREELFLENIPDGRLCEYIMASASFPLFKPTVIDAVSYSDGGIANNLPENMLIERGYDTIISVSVKGPGFVRAVDRCGVNIIDIVCKNPEIGVMEFDRESIDLSIKSGYFECMHIFGQVAGDEYAIEKSSYNTARKAFGPHIISGLESAAKMCQIDPYRIYTFDELLGEVLSNYQKNIKLRFMCAAIQKDLRGRGILDSLGTIFDAANAIVYLSRHKNL